MSGAIGPGDVVVRKRGICTDMPRGTVCRVARAWLFDWYGEIIPAIDLIGWPTRYGEGWDARNFDPIRPGKMEFTGLTERVEVLV